LDVIKKMKKFDWWWIDKIVGGRWKKTVHAIIKRKFFIEYKWNYSKKIINSVHDFPSFAYWKIQIIVKKFVKKYTQLLKIMAKLWKNIYLCVNPSWHKIEICCTNLLFIFRYGNEVYLYVACMTIGKKCDFYKIGSTIDPTKRISVMNTPQLLIWDITFAIPTYYPSKL